jgi:hypothetical protein
MMYNKSPEELPSVNFVRECRVVVEIIGETLVAIKLGSTQIWDQLWTNSTTRQQIPFTALIIRILAEGGSINPIAVSSCIFMEDEKSETQVDGIINKVNRKYVWFDFFLMCNHCHNKIPLRMNLKLNSLKDRLSRLHEVLNESYPGNSHLIPSPEQIDVQKLSHGGFIMSDTYNQAQKVRRLLVAQIDGSYYYDCMNHLHNVWFGNAENELTKDLNVHLRANLDGIVPMLCVTTSMSAIIRAVDKEFSLSANYPKGHGKIFLEWIWEYYPGVLLLHLEQAAGSRQDLCTEGSMAIYINSLFYIEFLDNMLHKQVGVTDKPSILQQNLFVALRSREMIALSCLFSI